MPKTDCAFFLGANSKDGFVSFFKDMALEDESRRIEIIKSGPGCGKSTLMTKIASSTAYRNDVSEQLRCSSDPDSLDGIIVQGGKLCLWDGTFPHREEPMFPGVTGDYITTPPFINQAELRKKLPQLQTLAQTSAACYSRAYLMLSASHNIDMRIISMLSPCFDIQRLSNRAVGIAAREIPKSGSSGIIKKRFLDGITPNGVIRLDKTIDALCKKVYCIEDSWGFSNVILQPLLNFITSRGHSVYACYDPKNPTKLIHILVPALSLAFVTYPPGSGNNYYRKIRVDAYLNDSAGCLKGKARALKRLSASMVEDAVEEILSAHKLHDKIEELYKPHIDFAALNRLTAQLSEKLR